MREPLNIFETAAACMLGATWALMINSSVKNLNTKLDQMLEHTYEVEVMNVIGKTEPETFYNIHGQRVYLKIDGKTIEEYMATRD